MEEDNSVIREKLCAAATGDSPDGLMEIEEFVREAIRRDPAVVGVLRMFPFIGVLPHLMHSKQARLRPLSSSIRRILTLAAVIVSSSA